MPAGWPVLMACAMTLAMLVATRRRRGGETHKRGVLVANGVAAQRLARRRGRRDPFLLTLAGVAVPALDETKHFKIIGTTGTGKSTAIRELLGRALARGDRALIADPDGGYRRRFHDRYRGDVVLNPFEPDSLKWDPFAEIEASYDIEQLASALIPSSEDASAREWRGYARTLLVALIAGLRRTQRTSLGELWRLISAAPPEQLRPLVAGTPAQPFLAADNARMFASIRSVAVSALAALEHVHRQRHAPFSVRAWVREPREGAVLFLPYRAQQIAALRTIIAAWIRLAIFEALSQPEDRDQRLWVVVDELDALGSIDGLKDALARLRKFGGRCVLGFQSIAQVSSTYGAGDAQTIVENCGNTLILRCSGSEQGGTSQFASRLIGEREVVRRQVSRGSDRDSAFGARGARRSRNVSEQQVVESAVLSSQLEQLADFCGYLRNASSRTWLEVRFGARGPRS